ncbi:MAG TPA: FAD:protein FMN transferase [Candidatus Dormibacteraeota bacterium]|nr:FAD:protein FMN transferase [Candidatus Dormibacteraeota bacterium]
MTASVLGIADDRALGGSLRLVVTDPLSLQAAKAAVDEVIKAIDGAASRFREDSELSRLNAAPEREVVVSPLLGQALAAGLRGAQLTEGAVDPTVGTAIKLAGYDADFAQVIKDGGPLRVRATRVPGWQAIRFEAATRRVWIPRGVEIDLGATAKALAADLAARAAEGAIARGGVLVSLGGDIAVAGDGPVGGWPVQVSEDSGAPLDEREEAVTIDDGGIATSSTTVRRWTRGGVVQHHIIDPATGLPVDGPWRTATVAAASCVDANIASTAAIVMGRGALAWLERHRLAARLVDQDGRVERSSHWPTPAVSKLLPNIF